MKIEQKIQTSSWILTGSKSSFTKSKKFLIGRPKTLLVIGINRKTVQIGVQITKSVEE